MYKNNNEIEKMKEITSKLKKGEFDNFYLLYGIEPYLINFYENMIKNSFVDVSGLNKFIYTEENFQIDEVSKNIIKYPIFNDKKLIVFKNINMFSKKIYSDLISYFEEAKDYNIVLIVENENKENYRYKEKYDEKNKLYKFINDNGIVLHLKDVDDSAIIKFIENKFKKYNKTINAMNISLIIKKCGKDLFSVQNEIDKIIAYVGDRNVIEKEDVEKVITKNLQEQIFKFIDKINMGNKKEALYIYSNLPEKDTDNRYILVNIRNNYKKMLQIKDMFANGMTNKEIAKNMSEPLWRVEKYQQVIKKISIEEILNKLMYIDNLDNRFMNGDINDNLLIELLI